MKIIGRGIKCRLSALVIGALVPATAPSYAGNYLYDGKWIGVSRTVHPDGGSNNGRCSGTNRVPVDLVIKDGHVTQPGARDGWEGSVDDEGTVVMRTPTASKFEGFIKNGFLVGRFAGPACYNNYVWRKG